MTDREYWERIARQRDEEERRREERGRGFFSPWNPRQRARWQRKLKARTAKRSG